MSELWIYMNGHVTGVIQPDQGQRGHQDGKKYLISSKHDYKQKFKIDLNQNFEIPRVRSLRVNPFSEVSTNKSKTTPEIKFYDSDNSKNCDVMSKPVHQSKSTLSDEENEDNVTFIENESDDCELDGFNKILETPSKIRNKKRHIRDVSEKDAEDLSGEKCSKTRNHEDYEDRIFRGAFTLGRSKARKRDTKKKVRLVKIEGCHLETTKSGMILSLKKLCNTIQYHNTFSYF